MNLSYVKLSLAEMHPVVSSASKKHAELLAKAINRKISVEERRESNNLHKVLQFVKPVYRALRKLESIYSLKPGENKVRKANDFYRKVFEKASTGSVGLFYGQELDISNLKIPSPENLEKPGSTKDLSISEMGKTQREAFERKRKAAVAAYRKLQNHFMEVLSHAPKDEVKSLLEEMKKAGYNSIDIRAVDIEKKIGVKPDKELSRPKRRM